MPIQLDRRMLLAVGAAALVSTQAQAAPFFASRKLPIGLQLYTLGPEAAADLDATFAAVAKIGYRDIELPGLIGKAPAELKTALDRAGLTCSSVHVGAKGPAGFEGDLGKLADALATLGARHAIMPMPYIPDRAMQAGKGLAGEEMFRAILGSLNADDWKMNADFLNQKAAALSRSGISVGYHNHNMEFARHGSTTGLEILLSNTDPKLVTFEADVGWIAAAGLDPLALIQQHKGRFTLMHVKDVKATSQANTELRMDPTEVGSGRIDWRRLLPGAYAAGVRHFYVEQEPPFARPRIEAAKLSYDFLAKLG